jgi:hypothetical protein
VRWLALLLLAGCQPTVPAKALVVCGIPVGAVGTIDGVLVFVPPERVPENWVANEIVELSPEGSIVQDTLEACDIGEEEIMGV